MLSGGSRRRRLMIAAVCVGGVAAGTASLAAPAVAVNTAHTSIVSANPDNFTPHVMNGSVQAIVQIGTKIVAAGTFTTVRQTLTGPDITRNYMFAFNATTGVIDTAFNPNFGGPVKSLATDGTYVYAGGSFTSVSGQTATKRVAKLTATGALVPGLRAPNNAVNDVVLRGSRLYVGGKFTNVGGTATPRAALAALDVNTGAVLADVNVPFTGIYNGGATGITRMDLSPDGTSLLAVGNFATVAGQAREQAALVSTPSTGAASLSSWSTDRFSHARNPSCATVFDSWMRDVDFSPDGSYFAITTTGAFGGGAPAGTMCDTTSRWENPRSGAGQEPTWVDYTGGDTTYGVAVTGSAIYVGGHMRWENNPFQGDQAGPGAVPREGIAALDPVNGLPLSWNPGRAKGVGAEALYATPAGLWVGSDTTLIGGEKHYRIAFMPLAGGRQVPVVNASSLPNTLFLAQQSTAGVNGIRYRVNTGGPALQASDGGSDWEVDAPYRNDGSNTADWGSTPPVNATVPSSTPSSVFATERWDPDDATEMHFEFPVPAGQQVDLRLYFADRCGCTANVGDRVFNVNIEGGAVEMADFDINAEAGHNVGMMREFTVTSDGTIEVDFGHVTENPLVNAIEIVDTGAGGQTSPPGVLLQRPVDASGSPTASASTVNTAIDWSTLRGAFLINSTLYYGLGDGQLYARSFTTSTGVVGTQRTINLYDDPDTGERIPFAISNLTGMFYDVVSHRLYYTVFGDSQLYFRYFTPESEVVGAQTFVADGGGVDFSRTAGMTLAGGRILYGSTADGALRSVPFSGGVVTGSPSIVSNDGTWRYRAIFAPSA